MATYLYYLHHEFAFAWQGTRDRPKMVALYGNRRYNVAFLWMVFCNSISTHGTSLCMLFIPLRDYKKNKISMVHCHKITEKTFRRSVVGSVCHQNHDPCAVTFPILLLNINIINIIIIVFFATVCVGIVIFIMFVDSKQYHYNECHFDNCHFFAAVVIAVILMSLLSQLILDCSYLCGHASIS